MSSSLFLGGARRFWDLPEARAGFVGAERAFEGDDGDDVMSEIECGDGGVPSGMVKSSRCLGRVEWSDSALHKPASSNASRTYVAGVAFGLEPCGIENTARSDMRRS